MDKIDLSIIRELQTDGRLTNQVLSERVGLSPSPCLRRVRALEARGIIRGYAAVIDQKAFGLPITVFVRISLTRHAQETVARFEDAVQQMEEVMECHLLTGTADYQLRVVVADLEDYERFMRQDIQGLPGIASVNTSLAYGEVKRITALRAPRTH